MNKRDTINTAIFAFVLAIAVMVASAALSGCGLQKLIQDGVDASVKVRPGGKNPDMVPPPAPKPAPPPDDWAPPWFRRPKPETTPNKNPRAEWLPPK